MAELHCPEVKFGRGAGTAAGFWHSHGRKNTNFSTAGAVKRPLTRFPLRRNIPLSTAWGEDLGVGKWELLTLLLNTVASIQSCLPFPSPHEVGRGMFRVAKPGEGDMDTRFEHSHSIVVNSL